MDENEVKNQQLETPEYEVTTDELKEKIEEVAAEILGEDENKRPEDVVFRHPHQILSNKQIQLLMRKQAWLEKEKKALIERGEDESTAEELTPTEKSALDLFLLRLKHQNSKPKVLSSKQRTAKRLKRRMTKKSRKANRV